MATFDVQKARESGYSFSEIADFMGQSVGYDTTAARKAGYKDVEIINHINSKLEKESVLDDMTTSEKFFAGVGKGYTDVGQGLKQIAIDAGETVGALPEGSEKEYTQKIFSEEQEYDKPLLETTPGSIGRIVGQTAPTAAIPIGGGASTLSRAVQGSVGGAIGAGVLPVQEGGSRLENTLLGAGVGGASGAAFSLAGRGYRGLRGDSSTKLSQELGELSKQYKIPLSVGELRNNQSLKRAETLLERIPIFGTGAFRKRQGESIVRASKALVNKYGQFEDVGEVVQDSLKTANKKAKQAASKLFDEVESLSTGDKFNIQKTKDSAYELFGKELELPDEFMDENLIKLIDKIDSVDSLNFGAARKLRSRIGSIVRQAEKKAVQGGENDEYVAGLKRLYSSLEEDMTDFAERQGGELKNKYRQAQEFFKEEVVPFKNKDIRKVGTDDYDTDKLVGFFIKNDSPKRAAKLISKLDDEGKAAIKYAILEDAFDKAMDVNKSGQGVFSPNKFATQIEKLGKTANVVFGNEDTKLINGFAKLMRAAERAGQYMENPPTGNRAIDVAVLGGAGAGMWFEPGTIASAAITSKLLSSLLTSNLGRRVLTRASGLPEKSDVWRRLITYEVPRAISVASTEEKRQKEIEESRKRRVLHQQTGM